MSLRPAIISVEHAGQTWRGEYWVQDGFVHIGGAYGTAERALTGKANEAEALAREELLKLVKARQRA